MVKDQSGLCIHLRVHPSGSEHYMGGGCNLAGLGYAVIGGSGTGDYRTGVVSPNKTPKAYVYPSAQVTGCLWYSVRWRVVQPILAMRA